MTSGLSIGNGFNTLNDPYFQQAYQSYNPNYAQIAQQNATAQTSQATQAQAAEAQQQVLYNAPPKEEKKSNFGKILAIGAGIAIVGAGICAYRKGSGSNVIERLKDGFGKIWNGIKGKASVSSKETFKTMQNNKGEWVCEIPGQKQRVGIASAEALNISTNNVKLGDKGTDLIMAVVNDGGNQLTIRGDKLVSFVKADGTKLLGEDLAQVQGQDTTKELIKLVKEGSHDKLGTGTVIEKLAFNHTDGNTVRRFVTNNGITDLDKIITNRFNINSPAVDAYRRNNAVVDEALKQITQGKIPETLNVASASANVKGAQLVFENGKVTSIDGNKVGSNLYESYLYHHPDTPLEISQLGKKVKLINPVYAAAA